MKRKGILYPVAVVAAAVALGLLLTREPAPPPREDAATERADYFFEGFTTTTYREDGQLRGVLHGDRAYHYPDRGELEVETPMMEVISDRGDLWLSSAPFGLAREAEGTLLLTEEVVIQRPATAARPRLTVETRDLLMDTREGVATSDAPSRAYDPGGIVSSRGLTIHFHDDRIELHDNARGRYEAP